MAQKVEKLKGIIFDKDGTLFDYAQVWETILKEGIALTFNSMGKQNQQTAKQAMLSLMGIDEDGRCIPRGLVFTHRRIQILRRFLLYCIRYRVNAIKAIKGYNRSVKHSEVLLNEKLKQMDFSVQQSLFKRLKEEGYHIGVITSDNASSTNLFLSLMGLEKMVDFIASRDSNYHRKPHSEAFNAFCAQAGITPSQVAMVGDTLTDMLFAKRAQSGYRVAVLSGSNDRRRLERLSDVVYEDISSLHTDTRLFPAQ